jgi:hypothetical protein
MSELAGHVRAALAGHGPVRQGGQSDRMGLFSVPFRPAEGPLADRVLKPYRSGRDLELLEPLARRHTVYLECLQRAGLVVPETELVLLEDHGVLRPVIVQEAVPSSRLLSNVLTASETASALRSLESVATAVCGFWGGVAQRPERIGLHASVHNFAIDGDGRVLFLDTFPPLIGLSREDMGRLLLRFSESGLMRGIGALLPGRVREIQDPWYGVTGNLNLLIEGSLRLRPCGPVRDPGLGRDLRGRCPVPPGRGAPDAGPVPPPPECLLRHIDAPARRGSSTECLKPIGVAAGART